MRYGIILSLLVLISGVTQAQDNQPASTPQQRIAQLEARVAQLENLVKPLLIEHEIKLRNNQNRQLARERMQLDGKVYTSEQLKDLENLYQAANKNLKAPEARANLLKVVSDYPKANRVGCALVYLSQISTGDEQIQFLKQAIENYGDCFYGNGVQVGDPKRGRES